MPPSREDSAKAPVGRLHVLTDTTLQRRFDPVELAKHVLDGGADTIQFRQKEALADRERWRIAAELAALCARYEAQLIIDDRADIARAVARAGAHVGNQDLPAPLARHVLGRERQLGMTVNDEATLEEANGLPVDYVGIGPVYGTTSKASPPPALGLDVFATWAKRSAHPVIAIGSIQPEQVAELITAGAYGVAVLSGIITDPDPTAATRRYLAALDSARKS